MYSTMIKPKSIKAKDAKRVGAVMAFDRIVG